MCELRQAFVLDWQGSAGSVKSILVPENIGVRLSKTGLMPFQRLREGFRALAWVKFGL